MRRSILSLAVAGIASVMFSGQTQAASVLLGTASGGMMVHYNNIDNSGAGGVADGVISGYDENPANIAYITSQFSSSNTNGSPFSFATPTLQAIFGEIVPTQFGFDLVYQAPTYNNAGGVTVPSLDFKDNVDGNSAHAATSPGGTTAFSISDYLGTNGPANPVNANDNSLFRGTGMTFNVDSLSVSGTVYTLNISGTLVTDGLIHWYTPSTPDTSLASLGLSNVLTYSGVLTYDKAGDFGSTQTDFYTGSVAISATAVPLPASAYAGFGLLGLLAVRKRLAARPA